MPTPAWRAISSSGASRPWSQNTCRAAARMASRLRWASRRSRFSGGRAGSAAGRAVVMPAVYREYGGLPPPCASLVGRSEGYLRSGSMTYPEVRMGLDIGLLLLRVVVGLTLAAHGAQKLFGWFGGRGLEGTAQGYE